MDIPDGQTIPSAATHVPNADTPNLVPIPVTTQPIPTIPVLSINELRNVIPVGSYSIPPQNLILGRIAAGHLLQVRSIPERNPAYAEDLLVNQAPTASAVVRVQPVDTQKPVLTQVPVTPTVTIPALSINEPQNVIPVVKRARQRNHIPGHTAAGPALPVHSTAERNPVLAEDPPLRPVPTVSAEIAVLPVDIQKQRLQPKYHSQHPGPAVPSVQPVVKLLRRNIRQATQYRLLPADAQSQRSYTLLTGVPIQ